MEQVVDSTFACTQAGCIPVTLLRRREHEQHEGAPETFGFVTQFFAKLLVVQKGLTRAWHVVRDLGRPQEDMVLSVGSAVTVLDSEAAVVAAGLKAKHAGKQLFRIVKGKQARQQ